MAKKADIKRMRFGKLVALEEDGRIGTNVAWICKCDCGNTRRIKANSLLSGNSRSCGCGRIEAITKHNGTNTKLFNVWRNIKERCTNENYKTYNNYGGRGIKVCDEWLLSYEAFKEWAISSGYREGLTIDRIDVNGNYEPSNCRWATQRQQARNKRNNVFLEFDGKRQCLMDWSAELGVKYNTLSWRRSQGWSTEEILFGR